MRPLVVDASARIATLARPELAPRIFGAFDACAPALLRWEVGNVVHGRHAREFGDLARRERIVAALLDALRLVDQAGREDAIAEVVERTRLTFYDAAYLQLSLDERAPLLTEDRRLRQAAARVLGPRHAWSLDDVEEAQPGE